MNWGLIYNFKNKKAVSLAKEIYDFLNKYGNVFPEKSFTEVYNIDGYTHEEINEKADVVITIGGDGTILRALEKIEKPILGINCGGMGFLSEIDAKNYEYGLKRIVDKKYSLEERAKLKVVVDGKRLPDATNEATVQTARIAKMIHLQVFIEDELIDSFGGDGVIVATSTGSTSYALSAGGPILDPSVNAMVVVPLAPFKLAARPWVIPLEKRLRIKLFKKSGESKIVIDGESSQIVTRDSDIVITGSEKKALFIRFDGSFYQRVRLKLMR